MISQLKGLLADPSPAVQLDFASHARKLMASARRVQTALAEPPVIGQPTSHPLSEFEAGLRTASVAPVPVPVPAQQESSQARPASNSSALFRLVVCLFVSHLLTSRELDPTGQARRTSVPPQSQPAPSLNSSGSLSPSAGAAPAAAAAPLPKKASDAGQKTANPQTGNTSPLLVAQVAATYHTSGWGAPKPQPLDVPPEKQRSCVDSCLIM